MTLPLLVIALFGYLCYVTGVHYGKQQDQAQVREAYFQGCKKGGNAHGLTPFPLCPRAADNYVEGSESSQEGTWE